MAYLLRVLALLAFLSSSLAGAAAVASDKAMRKNATGPALERVFMLRNPRTMAILDADFPREHAAVLASLRLLEGSDMPLERKLEVMFAQLKDIRSQYAARLRFAPVRAQQMMVAVLGGFMAQVEREVGAETCGVFARDGSGALFQAGVAERFAAAIDAQSAAFLTAVVAAIEDPEIHDPIQQEDWAAVFAQMGQLGHPRSFVETIAKGSVDDPELCTALGAMFRTAALMPGPAAARFRADFAQKLGGY